jgi:hypothetical protein
MSKPINLLSLVQAKINLSDTVFENFKNHHHTKFRSGEIDDLDSLISCLTDSGCSIYDFENFFVGYQIPQIGKEFDLLRFGSEYIINIELKKTSDKEKIEKQLTKNNYYLGFEGKKTYHYTYLSESGSLFKLSRPGEIETAEITELAKLLQEQESSHEHNIDSLFQPTNYLVSPFNSTERFLSGEYFLTQQQEEASDIMIKHLFAPTVPGFISLTGGAGTGKSLLAYHIARTALKKGKKVLIIHCGMLNHGHELLTSKGWEIKPIRTYKSCKISDYDLVIIDEAQRLYETQFKDLSLEIRASKALCIFSFDKLQTLATHEDRLDIESQISILKPISSHTLSDKIRSNKEIADFINMFFNKNKNYEIKGGKNIFLKYFSTNKDACDYLGSLSREDWQLLRFTPSLYNTEHHEQYSQQNTQTSHEIIGQEFDNVAVVIDELFSYHISGQLVYSGSSYYHPRKMLFQNITRARKKLLVVIINNEELLERCLTILR